VDSATLVVVAVGGCGDVVVGTGVTTVVIGAVAVGAVVADGGIVVVDAGAVEADDTVVEAGDTVVVAGASSTVVVGTAGSDSASATYDGVTPPASTATTAARDASLDRRSRFDNFRRSPRPGMLQLLRATSDWRREARRTSQGTKRVHGAPVTSCVGAMTRCEVR